MIKLKYCFFSSVIHNYFAILLGFISVDDHHYSNYTAAAMGHWSFFVIIGDAANNIPASRLISHRHLHVARVDDGNEQKNVANTFQLGLETNFCSIFFGLYIKRQDLVTTREV